MTLARPMVNQRGSGVSPLIRQTAPIRNAATVSTFESIVKKLKKLTNCVETSVRPACWVQKV